MKIVVLAKCAAFCLVVILFAGCLSLEQRVSSAAEEVISLINSGNSEQLAGMTATPFLLDEEIILLSDDMRGFWQNIVEAGFSIDNAALTATYEIDDKSFKEFGKGLEVESFFQKYVSKDGHIVVVETEDVKILLIMDRTKKKETKLIGFRGPVQS